MEPLFSKFLTPTDCRKRLSIPTRVLSSLNEFHGGHAVELLVRYEAKEWPLVCTIRKKGYKKPVLSKGWKKFVVENRLNFGDEVIFHKEVDDESGSLYYRVEVKRVARPSRAAPPSAAGSIRRRTNKATKETKSSLSEQLSVVGANAVGDVNVNEENSKSQYAKKGRKKIKLFGTIIGDAAASVVDSYDPIDHKAYDNSLKQFGLYDAQLDNGKETMIV